MVGDAFIAQLRDLLRRGTEVYIGFGFSADGEGSDDGLMEKPYTHTTWRVRAGSEDEFVRRWSEWVDWSHREGLEAPALFLRDLENPQAFISFGPWANMG